MPRRTTSSQLRSKIRQAQAKERQRIQRVNRSIHQHNNKVRQHNSKLNRAINDRNRKVRSHNTRVRANQARLRSALQRFARRTVTGHYASIHQSVFELSTAYDRLDKSDADPFLSNLAERDTANSVTVLNNLIADIDDPQGSDGQLTSTNISESLASISSDLSDRWSSAIFSLNPRNRDAARHFCTSTREIIADIINDSAPDADVFASFPDCETTDRGTPTRRAKIRYCMERNGVANGELEDFIDTNINDLSVLFKDLNTGAHGPAGRFSPPQLVAIKTRVEDAIGFVCEIVA